MPGSSRADRATERTVPRLASDNLRATVAAVVAVVAMFLLLSAAAFVRPPFLALAPEDFSGLRVVVLFYFGYWIGYSVLYMAMTWTVFHRADAGLLRSWLQESASQRRARRVREVFAAGSGPVGALFLTAFAVLAVVVVAVSPELSSDALVVGLAIGVVAVSWLLLVTAYAVHYAREEVRTGQLQFAGADEPTLSDYVYLAVQVSTTFSSSDVTVTGTSMRRTVSAHAVVAFAFNSVIIALLVSVLIASVS